MRRTTTGVFLLLAFTFFSCKTKSNTDKINKEELKKYFFSLLKDSTIKVDSFYVIKLDTLSQKNGYHFMFNKISNILDNNHDEVKKILADEDENITSYRLMAGNQFAGSLRTIYKENISKDQEKASQIVKDDSLYLKDIIRLDSIIKKADSIHPIAYNAKCFYQIKKADYSTERDTFYIKLNKDFNIIKTDEFIKVLPPFTPVSKVSFN